MTTENQAGESQAPTQPPAPSPSTEVHGLPATNRYGVDAAYFRAELSRLYHSLDNRPGDELARYLRTLADAAPSPEGTAPAPAAPGFATNSAQAFDQHPDTKAAFRAYHSLEAAPVSPGEPPAAPCPGIVTKDLANWTCTYNREGVCLTCGQPRPAAGDRPLVPADHVTGPDKMVPALDLEAIGQAMTLLVQLRHQVQEWGDAEVHPDHRYVVRWLTNVLGHLDRAAATPPASPPSGTGREVKS